MLKSLGPAPNAVADAACGEAVRAALDALPPWDPEEADDLTREVSQYLQRKVEVLLTSSERPPWEVGEVTPPKKKPLVSSKATKRQQNQHRPAANGGPNKRDRIRAMVATGAGGHDWVITSENKNNLLASCRRCTLFVQQVHKPTVFARIEAHPCLGREQALPEGSGVHPSHSMANVGRAWICKHCFIQLWVAYEKIPQGVAQQCRPSRKQARGGGQLAPYLPREFRPSWLQTEQQPATVPPRAKNRFRSKSQSPSRKEPPKLHSFFATPSPPPPAASHVPQDLGSREVGSKQQHNQQPASQPQTQLDTLYPESSLGREQTSSQASLSQSPALLSPPPFHPTGSEREVEGTRAPLPLPSFFSNGLGVGVGVELPLPRMAVALGVAPRQQRVEELAAGRTHPPRALGRHGRPVPGRAKRPSSRRARLLEPRPEGPFKGQALPIRQDRELEADYQRVAAKRAEQRPDAPRLSRSSYMRK